MHTTRRSSATTASTHRALLLLLAHLRLVATLCVSVSARASAALRPSRSSGSTASLELQLVSSVGRKGALLGEFEGPRHVAPLRELGGGGACVVDGLNHRLQLLDAEGRSWQTIAGLSTPTGIAVREDEDRLYVAESTGAHRVTCRRLSTGALLGTIGGLGDGDGDLHSPQCVEVAGDSLLVAEWGNNRISIFDRRTLTFERHVGATLDEDGDPVGGDGPGELDEPSDLAVHAGELFVADTWNHRVNVYGLADGAFRRSFGRRGAAPGEFTYPTGIAVANGCVYTTERMGGEANHRVQVLSLDGAPLQQLLPARYGRRVARRGGKLHGICVDGGRVWVTDSGMHMVHMLTTATPHD